MRAQRRDTCEAGIVAALEACGYLVYRMHTPADLLIFRAGRWFVLEVKGRRRNDQPGQDEFRRLTCTPIVGTAEQALAAVGAFDGPIIDFSVTPIRAAGVSSNNAKLRRKK